MAQSYNVYNKVYKYMQLKLSSTVYTISTYLKQVNARPTKPNDVINTIHNSTIKGLRNARVWDISVSLDMSIVMPKSW